MIAPANVSARRLWARMLRLQAVLWARRAARAYDRLADRLLLEDFWRKQ